MNLIQTLLLSVIEGVTEFLPISSTGHLILANKFLGITPTDFTKSFDIIIQLGAILAVVWLYKDQLLKSTKYWLVILAGFLPTAIVGFILYPFIKGYLLESPMVVVVSLFLGGLVLLIIDRYTTRQNLNLTTLTWKAALVIGVFQAISIIPGVSRAAATIIGGLLLGLDRKSAVEFSFLLAVPTMAAATGLDILKTHLAFSSAELVLLGVGFGVAFITAIASVKFLLTYVKSHSFRSFGIYRIVLAIASALVA
jgi:undecaprenyl-diphosphatase